MRLPLFVLLLAAILGSGCNFPAQHTSGGGKSSDYFLNSIPPLPDLAKSGMTWSPQPPKVATDLQVTITVQNYGTAAAGQFKVHVIFSSTISSQEQVQTVAGLAAGGSAALTFTVQPDEAGDLNVHVNIDPENQVIESNKQNNVSSDVIIVPSSFAG
jgi:subtilase family serine protease